MAYQAQQAWADFHEHQYQGLVGQHSPPAQPRVLAFGSCERVWAELLRHPDGSLAISICGADVPAFHWQAAEEERCVATFLRLLRR